MHFLIKHEALLRAPRGGTRRRRQVSSILVSRDLVPPSGAVQRRLKSPWLASKRHHQEPLEGPTGHTAVSSPPCVKPERSGLHELPARSQIPGRPAITLTPLPLVSSAPPAGAHGFNNDPKPIQADTYDQDWSLTPQQAYFTPLALG